MYISKYVKVCVKSEKYRRETKTKKMSPLVSEEGYRVDKGIHGGVGDNK